MKNTSITLAFFLCALTLQTVFAATQTFEDTPPDHTFYSYIENLAINEVISTDNTTYRSEDSITRFEAAKLISVAAKPSVASCGDRFDDVWESNVFFPYVQNLSCSDVIRRHDVFQGSDSITRAEFIKMIANAFDVPSVFETEELFDDVASDNVFAPFIARAAKAQLISNTQTNFRPTSPISRGEAAKIISNALSTEKIEVSGEKNAVTTLRLTTYSQNATTGEMIVVEAKALNAKGEVENINGIVEFSTDFGDIIEVQTSMQQGKAQTMITSPITGQATISARVIDFPFANPGTTSETATIDFVANEEPFQAFTTMQIIAPGEAVMIYLTLRDEYGTPLTGRSGEISYLHDGKGSIDTIIPVSDAEGVYASTYTSGDVAGIDLLSFRDEISGEETNLIMHVSDTEITTRPLQEKCSVLSTCGLLIQVQDELGNPITGALEDGRLEVFPTNTNYAEITNLIEITDDNLKSGVYYAEFKTKNHAEPLHLEVRMTAGNTLTHTVTYPLHDYIINMHTYSNTLNTINGRSVVVVTVEDVNGNRISLDPWLDFNFDVKTDVTVEPPYTFIAGWEDEKDWEEDAAKGIYITEIAANNSAKQGPIEIHISHNKVRNATTTKATIQAMHPLLDDTIYVKANGPKQLTSSNDFMFARILDSEGYGIQNLDTNNTNTKCTDNAPGQIGIESCSHISLSTDSDGSTPLTIATSNVRHLGGGLYIISSTYDISDTSLDISSLMIHDNNTRLTKVNPETNTSSSDTKLIGMFGMSQLVESISTSTDQRRSSYAVARLNPYDPGNGLNGTADNTLNPTLLSEEVADETSTQTTRVFTALPSLTVGNIATSGTGYALFNEINTNSEVSESTSDDFTLNYASQKISHGINVYSIKLDAHLIDDTNQMAMESIDAFVVPYMKGKRVYHYDSLDGAINVEDTDYSAYTSGSTFFLDQIQPNIANMYDGAGSLNEHPSHNVFGMQWQREAKEEFTGHAVFTLAVDEDDETQNLGIITFEVVNPRLVVFANRESLSPSSDETLLSSDLTNQSGVTNQAFAFAMSFDDHNKTIDLTVDDDDELMIVDVEGDAEVYSPESTTAEEIDDDLAIKTSINQNGVTIPGVYRVIVTPEDKTGRVDIEFASEFENINTNVVSFDIKHPDARLTIFPPGINLTQDFQSAYLMTHIREVNGRSIDTLNPIDNLLTFEVNNDEVGYSVFTLPNTNGALYFAYYSDDEVGKLPVEVLFNDIVIAKQTLTVIEK